MSTRKTPTERPIIFSSAMVVAILEGRKSQTRRAVKITHRSPGLAACLEPPHGMAPRPQVAMELCPFGQPGDRLWLRENGWELPECSARDMREGADTWKRYYYDADGLGDADHKQFTAWGFKRRPNIYMPRWASRITLEIEDVRAERLQDISEADANAEGLLTQEGGDGARGSGHKWRGIGYHGAGYGRWGETFHTPRDDGRCKCRVGGPTPAQCAYRELWDSINAKRAPWVSNPWVWCVSFRRIANAP